MKKVAASALGLSAILMGLVPTARAQQLAQQVPKTADITISGDSLRTVESRTIDSDYQNLIAQPKRGDRELSNTNSDRFRLKLNQNLQLITTPSDAASQGNPLPPRRLDSGSEAGVQLQLTPSR